MELPLAQIPVEDEFDDLNSYEVVVPLVWLRLLHTYVEVAETRWEERYHWSPLSHFQLVAK